MIIDAHMHINVREFVPDRFLWIRAWIISRNRYPYGDPDKIYPRVQANSDLEGEQWVKDMEYLGIDIGVNLTNDFGVALGEEAQVSIEEINRQYCLLAQKLPGKLYSFIGVDPRRWNAVEILEKGVKEWGAKGLKLLPHTGFYPNDRVCYRLYEKCVELGVPVSIHTGYGTAGLPMKHALPIYLDDPANDFPELDFIAAHASCGIGHLWEELTAVAKSHPNLYLELGEVASTVIKGGYRGSKGKYKDHVPMFLDMLDIWRNVLPGGCLNIMFGTDYPYSVRPEVIKEFADLFRNLPAVAEQYDYDFSQDEADLMCYKNAARIMKIPIPGD